MAQAGFTPISLYFSSTAAAVPTSGNLANGELALNIADMKLYAKNSAGTVTLLASNAGASGSVTSVAATVPTFLSITGSPITTSGTLAISLSGTALPTTSGGTGLTSFTSGGVVYASSTSALTTSSAFTWNGNTLAITGGNVGISAIFVYLAIRLAFKYYLQAQSHLIQLVHNGLSSEPQVNSVLVQHLTTAQQVKC